MMNITLNLTEINDEGKRVGKYKAFSRTLSPNPKSSQGSYRTKYKESLISDLERSKENSTLLSL